MTVRFSKHIALLLLGILFFPILFQPLHVLWHHAVDEAHAHHHDGGACCSLLVFDKHAQDKCEVLTEKESVCPICSYHFSMNELPVPVFYLSVVWFAIDAFNETLVRCFPQQVIAQNSPRAPPVLL
jgi:hypothetical protein